MQLISKLAIFAGSVTGITALSATYAYSQSANSIEAKEDNKENLVVPEAQVATQELQEESQKAEKELTSDEQEDLELLQEIL